MSLNDKISEILVRRAFHDISVILPPDRDTHFVSVGKHQKLVNSMFTGFSIFGIPQKISEYVNISAYRKVFFENGALLVTYYMRAIS